MGDASHEQGTIKLQGASRKQDPILEKARFHPVHGQGLELPVEAPQLKAVELTGLGRN
jgi:hypothetical protein